MGLFSLGSYQQVASSLGLTITDDYRIMGVVDGVSLNMWFETHATHVAAILPRPATVDFSLVTKGLVGKIGELFAGHHEGLGDPVDKVFALRSTAAISLVARLFDATARKTLLEIAGEGYHPSATHSTVHLHRWSSGGDFDSIPKVERDFRETARLARALSASFSAAQ